MTAALKYANVLVVEDDWLIRDSEAGEFRDAGWSVMEARSAEEALSLLQPMPQIDAVITDIRLAGNMDGFDLAQVIRSIGCDATIVYVSGSPQAPDRMVPGSVFRSKPVRPGELVVMASKLVAERQQLNA